jgi:hypothetical protein
MLAASFEPAMFEPAMFELRHVSKASSRKSWLVSCVSLQATA